MSIAKIYFNEVKIIMLDWDNPLENNTNDKVDIGLIDQNLDKTPIKIMPGNY